MLLSLCSTIARQQQDCSIEQYNERRVTRISINGQVPVFPHAKVITSLYG